MNVLPPIQKRMHAQRQLLEMALRRNSWTYTGLAGLLGVTRPAISQIKLGQPLPDRFVPKLAELTGLDAVYVMACIRYHRDQRRGRLVTLPVWEKIANAFQG